jgi:hypothetical protein
LMGGDLTLYEALNQVLKLEATKVAAGPPVRLWELTRAPARANQPSEHGREGPPVSWQCGSASSLPRECRRGPCEERNQDLGKRVNSGEKTGPPATSPSTPRFTLNVLDQGTHDMLMAMGWIQGKPCRVPIDTGATVTIAQPGLT